MNAVALFMCWSEQRKQSKYLSTDKKQIVVYPYSGILFSNKKEQAPTTYYYIWMNLKSRC